MRAAAFLKKAASFSMAIGVLLAGAPGIRPRVAATDYPVRESTASFTIGAALIPRDQVRKIFAADLNGGGCVVIEVGVFPAEGRDVDLSPGDFMLSPDTGKMAERPVDADAIAAAIGRKHESAPARNSDVYTTTGVTIDRVPTIDPATGRQTHTTVVGTEAGVGVGA